MEFLNSPFFAGLATIATGGFAIVIYLMQKRSEKINAAVSILFEIRNAESNVDIISEKLNSNSAFDLPRVLPSNGWKKYSHLFARDFDEDEFRLINTFYSSCEFIENLAERQNEYVWIAAEERARVAQQLLGEIHQECQKDSIGDAAQQAKAPEKFSKLRESLTKFYTDEDYFYSPKRPLIGLKFSIDHLQKITCTTCGSKLKKLAKV